MISISLTVLIVLNYLPEVCHAQPPIPPPPEVSWNPPFGGEVGGRTHYEMAGWSTATFLNAWTADIHGNRKNIFFSDEKIYVYVDTPANWLESNIWMYEYHQSNSTIGRWIVWMRVIGPGRFRFGPFYPQEFQNSINYTWKVWIYNSERDVYQDDVFSFVIGEEIAEYTNPVVVFVIALLALFTFKKNIIKDLESKNIL